MTKQESKMIAKAIEQQRTENRTVAAMINSDEITAYSNIIQAKTLIKVPVAQHFLFQMAALCYYMGVKRFNNSLVLSMVNAGGDAESIRAMHEMTMLNYTRHLN